MKSSDKLLMSWAPERKVIGGRQDIKAHRHMDKPRHSSSLVAFLGEVTGGTRSDIVWR